MWAWVPALYTHKPNIYIPKPVKGGYMQVRHMSHINYLFTWLVFYAVLRTNIYDQIERILYYLPNVYTHLVSQNPICLVLPGSLVAELLTTVITSKCVTEIWQANWRQLVNVCAKVIVWRADQRSLEPCWGCYLWNLLAVFSQFSQDWSLNVRWQLTKLSLVKINMALHIQTIMRWWWMPMKQYPGPLEWMDDPWGSKGHLTFTNKPFRSRINEST